MGLLGLSRRGLCRHGWLRRARHLLDGLPPCSERAWLEVREGSLCLLEEGDPVRALTLAAEGIRLHERPETSILRCWVATFKVWRLLQTGSIRLGDLSPTESWGDSSQNGLQNVCVVGDTELIWNRQQ